jgi:hypothetical protein
MLYRKHAPGCSMGSFYNRSMRCLHYSDHAQKASALPAVALPSFFFVT